MVGRTIVNFIAKLAVVLAPSNRRIRWRTRSRVSQLDYVIRFILTGYALHRIVTDVFNALQGFFIFLLFTLRQNTRNTIRKHFASSTLGRCCCKVTSLVPGLSSRKTTSSLAPGSSSSKMTLPSQQNGFQPAAGPPGRDDKADTPV